MVSTISVMCFSHNFVLLGFEPRFKSSQISEIYITGSVFSCYLVIFSD